MEEKDVHRLLYIAELIYRQREGALTSAEQDTLDAWLADSERNRQLFRELSGEAGEEGIAAEMELINWQDSFDRVYNAIGQTKKSPGFWSHTWRRAAAIFLLIMGGALTWFILKKEQTPNIATVMHKSDVAPGSRKAVLTLSNGSVIVLDDAPEGVVASQGKTLIRKSGSGQLRYDASGATAGVNAYNSITTPNGGEYQVVLPDGSQVWLNAASSIRFPATFAHDARRVEITGEAYFEVVKNGNVPFYVTTGHHRIEVLGTGFNVQSYRNDADITTTLLQGSIRIAAGANTRILKPGQQTKVNRETPVSIQLIEDADTEEALAWRNGKFIFNDTELQTVVRQLERWYDVNIDYTGLTGYRFNGEIPRSANLSKVLKMMELTSNIHYRINDRNIYLTK
ncbi:FecR family protein [Chitinophaga sp. RAB17]|uniref:FecR family protein n=1 Tax=Chitinophaga sp. RAB17 TaxID=3233049 RepID=UPI003F8F0918